MNSSSTISGAGAPEFLIQHVKIVDKTGPLFLSAVFHWGFFGVLCTQFFIYITSFPKDPLRNKLFVYIIFTLEVIQTIILTKSYFDIFGYGFGDPDAYDHVGAIWFSVPFLSGIVAFLAEVFYAMRLYRLSQSYTVPIAVCALAVIQVGGAIGNAIVVKNAETFSLIPEKGFRMAAGIWTTGSAACDVVIAYFMIRYLWQKRKDGLDTMQVIVNRIIRLVLETGTITGKCLFATTLSFVALRHFSRIVPLASDSTMNTAVFAVILLVLTMLPNHISYYQVPAAILAKLYSNSMLALLNSRSNIYPRGDVECRPPEATGPRLTVHRIVETFQDTGIDPTKPHEGYTSSVDEWSVEI